MAMDVEIRPLAARDSFDALTRLLHRAYAPLAAEGMNFAAASQSPEQTQRGAGAGQCFVAVRGGELVGTVTASGPYDEGSAPWTAAAPWFRHRDTAHFHQFAVDPRLQRHGIGRRLVGACEQWAREHGYRHMVLDTAVPALDLRGLYRRLGYRDVGEVRWEGKTFRSVVMRKSLEVAPLREHLQAMARYHAWATRRLLAAVAALDDTAYRADAGLAFASVHGTLAHLLVAEEGLWWPRLAESASPVVALDADLEPDRVALAERLVAAALRWGDLLAGWPESRFEGALAYRTTRGEAVALPLAPTLAHVFNHATHHRGQVSAALTRLGQPEPELDLVVMLQQEARRP